MSEEKIEFTATSDSTYIFNDNSKKIDFDKVNDLEDVIAILKAMDLTVWDNGEDKFEPIRHMLKDE